MRISDCSSDVCCSDLVTPDAQRSMNTYLGACVNLTPDDVRPAMIADAEVVYLEGYLWDPPQAKEAFLKAARIAHESGGKVDRKSVVWGTSVSVRVGPGGSRHMKKTNTNK